MLEISCCILSLIQAVLGRSKGCAVNKFVGTPSAANMFSNLQSFEGRPGITHAF
jgi:hypothetical protein